MKRVGPPARVKKIAEGVSLNRAGSVAPLVIINAVGMTSRLLEFAPRLKQWANRGWVAPLREVVPAVTSTVQASFLTGKTAAEHGIVANGWLFRDTMEIRFWQQSNRLLGAEPIYATLKRDAKRVGRELKVAKIFWWFNQGAEVDISVTPKPWYGADGNKVFGITGSPPELALDLERTLGKFPFATFWGPMAGIASTRWIAGAAARILETARPDLSFVYLPHLDYDPQRFGPAGCNLSNCVKELDDCLASLESASQKTGARLWVVSEYGHIDVKHFCRPNEILRRAGLLAVRDGPFGETVDTFTSSALAVCDHQLAHVYVKDAADIGRVADLFAAESLVDRVLVGEARAEFGLEHSRSGEIILLAKRDAWFSYRYWVGDSAAPDFAPTVDIHRKIGFDPCEMFFDPNLRFPKLRAAWRLVQKKLGFRTLFDVIATDERIVKGSHGLPAEDDLDRPICLADGPRPAGQMSPMSLPSMIREALQIP